MTDRELDERIERALHARAGDAPTTDDVPWSLASTARKRVQRRRNRRMGVAATLAVVATFGGVWTTIGGSESFNSSEPESAGGGTGSDSRADKPGIAPSPSRESDTRGSDPGWRWESYGGVEVQVPSGWTRYGVARQPWCSIEGQQGQQQGEIGRPGPIGYVKCPDDVPVDKLGEHVWLSDVSDGTVRVAAPAKNLGAGWVRDVVVVGRVEIEVQTRGNSAVRDRILGSVREISVDANGCPVRHPISENRFVRPAASAGDGDPVGLSVCRYGVGQDTTGRGTLLGSKRYAGPQASSILRAISQAPAGGGPDAPDDNDGLGAEAAVLRIETPTGVREVFVRYNGSEHNGFDDGTRVRRLTREALTFMTGPLQIRSGPSVTVSLLPKG